MKCSDCRFWEPRDNEKQWAGRCRREPPRHLGPGENGIWPETCPDEWCGAHRPAEEYLDMAQSAEARVRAECRECYEIGGVPCPGRLPKDETPAQEALNRAAAEAWVKRDEDSMILLGRALQEHAMSRLPSPYVQAKAALSAPPTVQAGSDARETEIYQRWTAQVQHLKDAVLAYAKRLPYPYAGELLAEWERAAIAGPDLRPPRREEDAP